MKQSIIITLACAMCVFSFVRSQQVAFTQSPGRLERFRAEEKRAVDDPFKGVTTNGQIIPGLFKLKSTGVSTKPVREAGAAFLQSLSDEWRKLTLFTVEDAAWRKWDNRHFPPRQGISFKEMSERQRELAFALFRASLSAAGVQKTTDIMKLNETLAELTKKPDEYGQWLYHLTVMGTPSDKEPWGWQLDGHHLVINYFVLGDQVVMTPTFMGSEPVRAESGKFKGTVVMEDEQNKALKLFHALDKEGQSKAMIRSEHGPPHILAQAYQDNLVLDYAGIPASRFNAQQKKLLLDLIAEYVGNMKAGHAQVRMDEVRQHLDQTYFAWIGQADAEAVFYYRIQSPVILIEFDHQGPTALPKSPKPNRNHIHTVIRTPNGNDYGKDLLRQHHQQHKHGVSQNH